MSAHARAALAAAVVVAAFALAPAAAGERATLRVTARVVDRCTVTVPGHVPLRLWRDRRHQPWRFVRHDCRGRPPLRIDARALLEQLRDQLRDHLDGLRDRARVHKGRHPHRDDVVLITITY
jgi:hypothetical protein